jgi:two-component system, NtrC family, nitrogen regulation sensor histidine kinase NtrY
MPLLSEESRRKRNLIIVAAFLILVGAANFLDVGVYASDLPLASNIAVFALLNLNLIVLLLLVLLLFRNLVKLWFERRQQVIGAKFKAKLVTAFLSLSLIPSMLIFLIASNFITKSIEGWFKPQVERPLDQALAVAQTYYANLERTALRHAQHIGRVIDRDGLLAEPRREALAAYLVEQQDRLGISAITVFGAQGQELVHVKDPILGDLATRDVDENQLRQGIAGQELTTVRELASGDLVEAVVPIWVTKAGDRSVVGVVVVGTHVTDRLEARVRAISQSFREFKQLKLLKTPIKGIYILLFLLMTLIVVFSFTWFGLYLARGITGPIEQLAEGTREVAAGNLAYKVPTRGGDDEIGVLVDSFNQMTDDLAKSKHQLEEAYLDLSDKHTELEDRRVYIETVLEAITTGVVSFDPLGRLTTINRAAARMLGVNESTAVGRFLEDVLVGPELRAVVAQVHRTRRPRAASTELEFQLRRGGATLSLLASATALRGPDGEYTGAVVVLDDLTELLKAQRVAAWREVAQRIAHEIKNPLTPIQLSAQRLRRRLARTPGEERLVLECTETIIHEVEGLKHLVDEFSRFARMPVLTPRPTDVRQLIDGVATLYRESHPALSITTRHADDLPLLEVDPDHIKRAVLNLVDNAVEAIGDSGVVCVETVHVAQTGHVRIIVADNGPGIGPEDRERLFLPYFSTKVSGMGLGLPIVHEIVTEHGGTIRVEDNDPTGTRFVIEVPVSRTAAPVEAS